ncbi:MAG TPA: hypothetical protein PKD86_01560 [Gemmatales bacterium]|nr:hypothetical protein [Gemmatales bacterium]HMP58013.1 hypothetical protein [Gemmatales bacterium]
MTLLDVELLTDLKAVPLTMMGAVVALGLGLWLCGWWWHRFWITILTSFLAGLVGLHLGPQFGVQQPVVAGVLLAMAGGGLALSLARLGLFAIYGLAAWFVMLQLAPAHAIPLICFTAGGLISIVFFRFCVMILTAGVGTVLLAYGGIALLESQLDLRVTTELAENAVLVHLGLAAVALIGVLVQARLARLHYRWARRKQEEALWNQKLNQLKEQEQRTGGLLGGIFRRAG